MRIRWRNFELPSKVQPDSETLTDEYGRFVVEPFERGFGHTIGNGLRRVLLSSIEGTAVRAVKIEGADHEFATLEGVVEDVTDLILNLKRLRIRSNTSEVMTCTIRWSGKGSMTGADVECGGDAQVINKDLHLAEVTLDREVEIDLVVGKGRGYVPAEENHSDSHELGTIAVDSIYSPVLRVRYAVEATRVGKFTNFDRLVVELWTDGTISPQMALVEAAKIYRKHLNPFVLFVDSKDDDLVVGTPEQSEFHQDNLRDSELESQLSAPISDLELSVRARNCLDSANLRTLRDLVSLEEHEVMNLKNLGKTSLTEIKTKLAQRGLRLGMPV